MAASDHGLIPLVVTSADPADVLRTYAALYLEQEVQAQGLVRNLGQFARFLEVVSFGRVPSPGVPALDTATDRKSLDAMVRLLQVLVRADRGLSRRCAHSR